MARHLSGAGLQGQSQVLAPAWQRPCTRATLTHPPLLLLPGCACRQGKTNLRASAMMTRKHNAAVKAQQKAERDKLRGQMRCALLCMPGRFGLQGCCIRRAGLASWPAARLAAHAHASCACSLAGLQCGAACCTGGQGAEEGWSGQRVRRARRRKHPRLVHVSLGWEIAISWETISGGAAPGRCRGQASCTAHQRRQFHTPACCMRALHALQAAGAGCQCAGVAWPGRRHHLRRRGLGQWPAGARFLLYRAGVASPVCAAASVHNYCWCMFRGSARLKNCPTACQPQPATHAPPPSPPSHRCCAPSTHGCRPACTLCPWHALRRGCRRGGRATLLWLAHGPARVSMGWGYASAPTLRC